VSERGPDFEAIVGAELEPAERDRLLRVHEALVAAGPPPEAAANAVAPSTAEPVRLLPAVPRRRRGALVALAAAFGVLVFAVGAVVGNAWNDPGTFDTVTMTGTAEAAGASASLELFDLDDAGNWPMEVRVNGLAPSASGRPFELWLTRGGEPAALCGSFRVAPDGTAVVPMNAPYRLDDFDGWVVVVEGSQAPLLTT
jgi:hypothetical protein